jgi:hypothetical protein
MAEHVDLIREAARLMRQRAEAATEGPWTAHPDGLVWAERLGDPVSGSTEIEDAEHIASWHPSVVLLVADWLDGVADDHRGVERVDEQAGECVVSTVSSDFKRRTTARHILPALAVARAYLRELDGSTHDGYPEVDRG